MFYLKAFLNSLYKFDWLKKQNNDLKKASNYFILFCLLLAILYSSFITFVSLPKVKKQLEKGLGKIPDLSLEVKDNRISISGVNEPFQTMIKGENESNNLFIYIDTRDVNNDYEKYLENSEDEDRVIITSSSISLYARDGMTTIQPASKLSEIKINKEKILSFFDNTNNIFIFSLIVFFVFFVFQRLVSILAISFIFYLILKRKKDLNYKFKNVLNIGFYAVTAPSIIVAILLAFGLALPFLYTLLFFLIMSFIFMNDDLEKIEIKKEDVLESETKDIEDVNPEEIVEKSM